MDHIPGPNEKKNESDAFIKRYSINSRTGSVLDNLSEVQLRNNISDQYKFVGFYDESRASVVPPGTIPVRTFQPPPGWNVVVKPPNDIKSYTEKLKFDLELVPNEMNTFQIPPGYHVVVKPPKDIKNDSGKFKLELELVHPDDVNSD